MKSILCSFLLLSSVLSAQIISNIDLDEIRTAISDKNAGTYYPKLAERFHNFDTTLTIQELAYLYYGYTEQPEYSPYGSSSGKEITKYFEEESYDKAIAEGLNILTKDPVNIKVQYYMMVVYLMQGDTASAINHARWHYQLLDVIFLSGDGLSKETAFVVNRVADEYNILDELEVGITQQELSGTTDVLTLNEPLSDPEKPGYDIETLYFNVSLPLGHLTKLFGEEEPSKKKKKRKKKGE
jgi:hypothetical protein